MGGILCCADERKGEDKKDSDVKGVARNFPSQLMLQKWTKISRRKNNQTIKVSIDISKIEQIAHILKLMLTNMQENQNLFLS